MKITVIDLLNRIAKGEKPEKIKIDDDVYIFNDSAISIDSLYRTENGLNGIDWLAQKDLALYDIVEIIVEDPEIDIQDIKEVEIETIANLDGQAPFRLKNKINELIRAIKQLDKQIKENRDGK